MKLKQKLIASILTVIMLTSYVSILKDVVIAVGDNLEEQDNKTNNSNIEFNSYFEREEHSKTFDIKQDAKIYAKIKVNNAGYLKNGIISFINSNFDVNEDNLKSDNVQTATKNEIKLKQINNNDEVIIEIPVKVKTGNNVDSSLFDKTTTVKFTGTYIDENGKENLVTKEINNRLKWQGTSEIELAGEISKFIPYKVGEEKGLLVQARIRTRLKENSLPTEKTKLEVSIPKIKISDENDIKPERITVLANSSQATNGKDIIEFGKENYEYNEQTDKVEIEVINKEENGTISWNKNVADEYLVNYIFVGEEIYSYIQERLEKAEQTIKTKKQKAEGMVNENAIIGEIEVTAKIDAYNSKETKLEKTGKISYSIEEVKGELINSSIKAISEISKGYIYANYAKDEKENNKQEIEPKKDTEYSVKYTAQINDKELVNSIEFITENEKYIDGEEKNTSNETIYTKQIKIYDLIFDKILGENGKIEILNKQNESISEITKNTEKDERGNYFVDIAKEDVNELIIKTSKPITEGNIEIILVKAIKAEQSYSKEQIEQFEKIELKAIVNVSNTKITNTAEIKLTEPVSKAQISIGTQNLSTIVKNENIELRAVLDTSSYKNALYKDPILQIVLPDNIEKLTIKSIDLLLEDELKIKNYKVKEEDGKKIIVVSLEGTQTKHMDNGITTTNVQENIIAKGANLVVKADITFKKLTPSSNENIYLYYTNSNTNLFENTQNEVSRYFASANVQPMGYANTEVTVTSPKGLITENHINGYKDGQDFSNVTDQKQEQTIDAHSSLRELTIGGTIVNNYENAVENVVILGRTPFNGNKTIDENIDLGSNFTIKMKEEIEVTGINSENVKIYYSTNGKATKDLSNSENDWKEEITDIKTVKSYLIVLTGEIANATQIDFNYKAELPEDIPYSSNVYTTYKVYFDNKTQDATLQETKTAGTIGLITPVAPELSIDLKSTANIVREGQIVKMKAIIKNDGTMDATNVKVNVPVPESATFSEYIYGNGFFKDSSKTKEFTIEKIEAGKSKEICYYIKFDDEAYTTIEEENTNTYPKEVKHKISLTAKEIQETVYSNEYIFNIEKGEISISMHTVSDEMIAVKRDEEINYTINLTNISDVENIDNTIVTISLPQGVKYVDAKIKESIDSKSETKEGINYNESTRTFTANVGTLQKQKVILLDLKVEDFEGNVEISGTVKADNIQEHYSNITEYSIEKIDLKVSELTSTPKYVKEGENVIYTLKITNNSKSTVSAINLIDVLPEGLDFLEATYTYGESERKITNLKNGRLEIGYFILESGESTNIKITAKAKLLADKNEKQVQNSVTVTASGYDETTTNKVTNIIVYNEELHKLLEGDGDDVIPQEKKYKVTGTAWIDSNKNGKRDDEESLLPNVQVVLVNKSDSQLVVDKDNGSQKVVTTDENGKYEFLNIPKGEYIVVFLYDAGKYNITEYQAKQVDKSLNSDAVNMKITLNGKSQYAGVTDIIKVTSQDIRDIDIGVYVTEKFDLKLDKYISKITLTTQSNGTKVYNYDNEKIMKIEVYGKDVNNSRMVIEYKIVVTNEGQVPGYVKKIIDYLPEDAEFKSELNEDWYISNAYGTIYNTSLENVKIQPGESKEVKVILSVGIADKNIGTMINNNAEIYESYNELGLDDFDSIPANMLESEDDMSSADIMLSISTGKIIVYITLTLVTIILLSFGIYEIKKHVLNKKFF